MVGLAAPEGIQEVTQRRQSFKSVCFYDTFFQYRLYRGSLQMVLKLFFILLGELYESTHVDTDASLVHTRSRKRERILSVNGVYGTLRYWYLNYSTIQWK